jgi:predicted enzyme related to lactoylglutathione lyase
MVERGPMSGVLGPVRWVTIDVSELERSSRFWTEAAGVEVIDADEHYVWMTAIVPGGPGLVLQRVDGPKREKCRVHLDFRPADVDAAISWVVANGGRHLADVDEPDYRLAVVADPDGNELCLLRTTTDETRREESA